MADDMKNGATEHAYNLSSFFERCHSFNDKALLWLQDGRDLAAEREDLVKNSRRYGALKKQTDEALAKLTLTPAKGKKVKALVPAPLIDYINQSGDEDGSGAGAHD